MNIISLTPTKIGMEKHWIVFNHMNKKTKIYALVYTYSHQDLDKIIRKNWQVSCMCGNFDDFNYTVMMKEIIQSSKVSCPSKPFVQIPSAIVSFIQSGQTPQKTIYSPASFAPVETKTTNLKPTWSQIVRS